VRSQFVTVGLPRGFHRQKADSSPVRSSVGLTPFLVGSSLVKITSNSALGTAKSVANCPKFISEGKRFANTAKRILRACRTY
jgi:hypothetical protein